MAKYVVKAHNHKNQVRVSIPRNLTREMDWLKTKFFIIEKVNKHEIKMYQFLSKQDLE